MYRAILWQDSFNQSDATLHYRRRLCPVSSLLLIFDLKTIQINNIQQPFFLLNNQSYCYIANATALLKSLLLQDSNEEILTAGYTFRYCPMPPDIFHATKTCV